MKKLRLISLKAFFAIAITFLLGNSVEISSLAQTLDEPALTADYSGMLLTENQNTENGYVYEINGNGTAVITGYVGTETALVVPDTLGGYKVTEIGKFAFHYCSEITSITLPTGITTIGDYAFNKCNRLTRIVSLYLTLQRTFIAITKTAPLLKKPVASMAMPMPMVL